MVSAVEILGDTKYLLHKISKKLNTLILLVIKCSVVARSIYYWKIVMSLRLELMMLWLKRRYEHADREKQEARSKDFFTYPRSRFLLGGKDLFRLFLLSGDIQEKATHNPMLYRYK